MKVVLFKILVFAILLLFWEVAARPSRVKRVSDQRMAELETLLALSKMQGKLVTIPLAFGKLDPMRLGRKRRSQQFLKRLFQTSDEENEENHGQEIDDIYYNK